MRTRIPTGRGHEPLENSNLETYNCNKSDHIAPWSLGCDTIHLVTMVFITWYLKNYCFAVLFHCIILSSRFLPIEPQFEEVM